MFTLDSIKLAHNSPKASSPGNRTHCYAELAVSSTGGRNHHRIDLSIDWTANILN